MGLEYVGAWERWGLFLFDTAYRRLKGTIRWTVMVRRRMALSCPLIREGGASRSPYLEMGTTNKLCVSDSHTEPHSHSTRAETGL